MFLTSFCFSYLSSIAPLRCGAVQPVHLRNYPSITYNYRYMPCFPPHTKRLRLSFCISSKRSSASCRTAGCPKPPTPIIEPYGTTKIPRVLWLHSVCCKISNPFKSCLIQCCACLAKASDYRPWCWPTSLKVTWAAFFAATQRATTTSLQTSCYCTLSLRQKSCFYHLILEISDTTPTQVPTCRSPIFA